MAEPLAADGTAPPAAADGRAWTYTVSVRSLCEFTAKRGDLDRRFTPAATALEGLQGQSIVASRRSLDYETEVALETVCGPLRVRGRADGYDPRRRCLLPESKSRNWNPHAQVHSQAQVHIQASQTQAQVLCERCYRGR